MNPFETALEEFAMKYRPMQHVPGKTSKNKRLFYFDSIVAIPDFMTRIKSTQSPCMGYEFPLTGEIKGGKILPVYTIYFFVKMEENKATGKELSAEANQEAFNHALKFIVWLKKKQEEDKSLVNIDLENEIPYYTYGPLMIGWFGLFLKFRDVDKFTLCIDENDFIE